MDDQQYGNDGADFQLSEQDKAAVDALFDGSGESNGADTERFDRVSRLLGLLDTPVADEGERGARINVTELRVQSGGGLVLGAASASSVDDWMDHEESMTARDETHSQMASLLTDGPSYTQAERDALVERTLEMIQREIDRSEKRYILDLPISPKGRFRLADLVTLAATLLLVASVTIPVLSGMRSRSMQAQCLDNMASASRAFGMYSGSNRDTLPMATAGFGTTWLDVGTTPERSNSSNLYMLVRTKHATLDDLACPTNPNALVSAEEGDVARQDWKSIDEISYSYRIMAPGGMKAHDVAQPVRVVLLSDRSPATLRIVRKQPVRSHENTPNHDHQGQHVLGLDGSSVWHRDPILDQGDNLWLPRPIEQALFKVREEYGIIKGNELPSGPNDAFVGP